MIDRRDRLRLTLESVAALCVRRQELGQYLDRDLAMEPRVLADVDLAHAAFAERLEDAVVIELRSNGHVVSPGARMPSAVQARGILACIREFHTAHRASA